MSRISCCTLDDAKVETLSLATSLMVVGETSSFNLLKLRITGRWLWREQKAIVADCVCLFSRPAKWTASPRAACGRRRRGRDTIPEREDDELSVSLFKEDRSVKCNFPPTPFLSLLPASRSMEKNLATLTNLTNRIAVAMESN